MTISIKPRPARGQDVPRCPVCGIDKKYAAGCDVYTRRYMAPNEDVVGVLACPEGGDHETVDVPYDVFVSGIFSHRGSEEHESVRLAMKCVQDGRQN